MFRNANNTCRADHESPDAAVIAALIAKTLVNALGDVPLLVTHSMVAVENQAD